MAAAWDVSDYHLLEFARAIREGALAGGWYVKLFRNDVTIEPGFDYGSLVEADFAGYAPYLIPDGEWGPAVLTDHVATIPQFATATFTASGAAVPQIIYGYYMQPESEENGWVERFPTPRLIGPSDSIAITPRLKVATYPAS